MIVAVNPNLGRVGAPIEQTQTGVPGGRDLATREIQLVRRERVADERDRIADQREVIANERELLAELRRMVNDVDPVPPEVTAYANAALGWRRIDAELAELLPDSELEPELAGTRSGLARARSVTFEASELTIELELEAVESGYVLLGQLAPPCEATVDVQRDDHSLAATGEAEAAGHADGRHPGGR